MIPPKLNIPYGDCQCGCGAKASPGYRYIAGHHKRIRLVLEDAQPFKIDGVYCRLIPLTQGQYAIVDAEDYIWLMSRKWYARWDDRIVGFYALSNSYTEQGKRHTILMHREILEKAAEPCGKHTDHRNGITIDNRRKNIRPATHGQNQHNQKIFRGEKQKRKGVTLRQDGGKWQAYINVDKKRTYLGRFDSHESACAARESAEAQYHKEFARKE
jgi:hypothetical protein